MRAMQELLCSPTLALTSGFLGERGAWCCQGVQIPQRKVGFSLRIISFLPVFPTFECVCPSDWGFRKPYFEEKLTAHPEVMKR